MFEILLKMQSIIQYLYAEPCFCLILPEKIEQPTNSLILNMQNEQKFRLSVFMINAFPSFCAFPLRKYVYEIPVLH